MYSATSTMNTISEVRAWRVMSSPHEGPTVLTVTSPGSTPAASARASATSVPSCDAVDLARDPQDPVAVDGLGLLVLLAASGADSREHLPRPRRWSARRREPPTPNRPRSRCEARRPRVNRATIDTTTRSTETRPRLREHPWGSRSRCCPGRGRLPHPCQAPALARHCDLLLRGLREVVDRDAEARRGRPDTRSGQRHHPGTKHEEGGEQVEQGRGAQVEGEPAHRARPTASRAPARTDQR